MHITAFKFSQVGLINGQAYLASAPEFLVVCPMFLTSNPSYSASMVQEPSWHANQSAFIKGKVLGFKDLTKPCMSTGAYENIPAMVAELVA
jgi:hypothetical protein